MANLAPLYTRANTPFQQLVTGQHQIKDLMPFEITISLFLGHIGQQSEIVRKLGKAVYPARSSFITELDRERIRGT